MCAEWKRGLDGVGPLRTGAGVVGNTLLHSVLSIREEQFRMSGYLNHLVLCGYEPGAQMLLEAILEEVDPERTPVVLFADGERAQEVPPELL